MVEDFRELKLGKSFTNDSDSSFHTLRYDFKPASIDEFGIGTVKIENGNRVTAHLPNVENAGKKHTTFCGSRKPSQKECILIIDHDTGEITLEKLSSSIQLKKIRLANNLPKNVGGQNISNSKVTSTTLPIIDTQSSKKIKEPSPNLQIPTTLTPRKAIPPVAQKHSLVAKKTLANNVKAALPSPHQGAHRLSLSDSEDNFDSKDNEVMRQIINKNKQGPPPQTTPVTRKAQINLLPPTPLSEKEDGEMDDDDDDDEHQPPPGDISSPHTPSVPPLASKHVLNLTVSSSSSSSSASSRSTSSPSSSGTSSRDSSPLSSRDSLAAPPTPKMASLDKDGGGFKQIKPQHHHGHKASVDLDEDLKLSESDSRSDDSD